MLTPHSLTVKGDDLDYDLTVEENCGKYFLAVEQMMKVTGECATLRACPPEELFLG